MELFATCPTGFEQLLADELRTLGMGAVRPLQGQVAFQADVTRAMRACLWSRLASRVVAVLGRVGASSSDELYEGLRSIAWEEHLAPGSTFAVDASGTNAELRTTQFVALRAKDAVVDRMRHATGARPSVDTSHPDLRIVVRISRNRATVGIDLAGEPLFRRGYERSSRGLRPDYAAAMLALGAWATPDKDALLLDLCGSEGTLLVEAASVAARQAPGILRARWGFMGWASYDERAWQECLTQARDGFAEQPPVRLASVGAPGPALVRTLRTAGLACDVRALSPADVQGLGTPTLLACDLIGTTHDVAAQAALVQTLRQAAHATRPEHLVTLSRDSLPDIAFATQPERAVLTKLGRDDARLASYGTLPEQAPMRIELPGNASVTPLVGASDQFAARLKKVAKQRGRWARREDVSCYRVYDADLPDYALTIDLYQGADPRTLGPSGERWLQVSEYAPPKEVDPALARSRLLDALAIASATLDVPATDVYVRVRRHGKGGSQYADEATSAGPTYHRKQRKGAPVPLPAGAHLIDEGGLLFEVNFSTHLDCGIFLDHRDTRSLLRERAKQTKGSKRFLNLFAYTGTATCYAADGGAKHTTTVDLSRPSLDWARRNMERNGFAGPEHEYVQADVVRWVTEQRHTRNRWDLVFCDVPTFSNSRRMRGRSFDVQRDHAELLIGISRLLTRDGVCVFSCNLRTFSIDAAKLERAKVEVTDITDQTIPADFARNTRVHHTFLIRRAG